VAWFHLTNGSSIPLLKLSGYEGRLGVPIFFAISGFVIPYSLHAESYRLRGFWRFMSRRLVRLEPPYLVSVAVAVILGSLLHRHYSLPQLASHLLYLVPFTPFSWVNSVYWTLTYEFVFYLSAALLFPVLWRRNVLWTVALGAASQALLPVDHEYYGLILTFVMGVVAARRMAGVDGRLTFGFALALTFFLMLACGGRGGPAAASLGAVLCAVFVKMPRIPLLAILASISYPLYLLHRPLGTDLELVLSEGAAGPRFQALLPVLGLASSIISALLLSRLVERPALRLSKRIVAGLGPAPLEPLTSLKPTSPHAETGESPPVTVDDL
jgi:peptidoglycan/LPS O-acetylase OafA/YrhL